MDDLLPLLFAAVVYFGPKIWGKIWKRYQGRVGEYVKYQQPNGKEDNRALQSEMQPPVAEGSQCEVKIETAAIPSSKSMGGHSATLPPPSPRSLENEGTWSGKMGGNAVIQGMIFAEIIQPPRAYRPFVRRK